MERSVEQRSLTWNDDHVDVMGGGWGCCPPLFEKCADSNVMQLYHGLDAVEPALRWFGGRAARTHKNKRAYLTYTGPAGAAAGAPTDGLPLNICGPGLGVEMGKPCYMEECGFGEIRRTGDPIKNGGTSTPYCDEREAWTVEGQVITNDEDWWLKVLGEQVLDDLACRYLIGDSTNTYSNGTVSNDSAGLFELFAQTYACEQLTPNVIDWGSNPLCSGSQMGNIVVNGTAVTQPRYLFNVYQMLRAILMANQRQLRMTRLLGGRQMQFGDVAILGPDYGAECLVECAVCFTQCGNDITRMDSEAALMKYDEWFSGGMGYGEIPFGNLRVPYIPYNPIDWNDTTKGKMENGDGTVKYMLLWRGLGGNNGRRFLIPEYNDLSDGSYETSNDGQFQVWEKKEDVCFTTNMRTEWRWWNEAPYLQTIIDNVACESLFGSMTPGTLEVAEANC